MGKYSPDILSDERKFPEQNFWHRNYTSLDISKVLLKMKGKGFLFRQTFHVRRGTNGSPDKMSAEAQEHFAYSAKICGNVKIPV